MPQQKIVQVSIPATAPQSYDILIEAGSLNKIGQHIQTRLGTRHCLIITDSNVAPLYLAQAEEALRDGGHQLLTSITLPAGESTKSWDQLPKLLEDISVRGGDRKTLLIALGGGVIGDITGFASAIYMRGTDFVQIPTTLLAQTDSSVGGKTGIDTGFGKNTVGAFHQPKLVIIDPQTLATLPRRQLLAGYAEVVKYGLVMNDAFFAWCEENGQAVIDGDLTQQIKAIAQCCEMKAQIVLEDEKEQGRRALLNLGHTFGHALESWTGFNDTLLHGEGVAIGTMMAFQLSVLMELCTIADVQKVKQHFDKFGLPTAPPAPTTAMGYEADKFIALMHQDKKAENGQLTLILTRGIGKGFIAENVDENTIRSFLQKALIN